MAYRSDGLKKTVTWSSPKIRDFLNAILKDHATTANCSESALIEESLFAHFIPSNGNAKFIAEGLYAHGLAHCYESVYHIYEAGINWNAAYSNGRSMVEAFRDASFVNGSSVDASRCVHDLAYCHKNLLSLADYLDGFDANVANYLRDLIKLQHDDPRDCNFHNLIVIILQTWEWIGNKSLTYRALASMCRIAPEMVNDDESSRCRFLTTLKEISTVWQ